ncbi:uncharacterized protein LOC144144982 [Haemaphysalis longicornis]
MQAAAVLFLALGLTSLAPQSCACWWPNRVLKRYFGNDDTTTSPPTTVVPDTAHANTIVAVTTATAQYVNVPSNDSDNVEPSDGVTSTPLTATHPETTAYPIPDDQGDTQTTMLTEAVTMSTAAPPAGSPAMPTEASTMSPTIPSSTAPQEFDSSSDDASETSSYDHYSTDVATLASDSTSTMTPSSVANATLMLFTLEPENPAASTLDSGHIDSVLQTTVYSDVVANKTAFITFSSVLTAHNEDSDTASTQFPPESPDNTVSTDYNWNSTFGTQPSVPSLNTDFVPKPATTAMANNIGTTISLPLSTSNISVLEPTTDVTTVAATEEAAFSPSTIAHVAAKQAGTSPAESLLTTLAVTWPHNDNALELTTVVPSLVESTASQTNAVMSSRQPSVIEDIGLPPTPVFEPLETETLPTGTQPATSGASMEPSPSALTQVEINHSDSSTSQQPVAAASAFPSSTVAPELTERYPQTTSTAPEATASRKYKPVYVRRFTPWLITRTSSTTGETSTLLSTDESTATSATVTAGHLQVDLNPPQTQLFPTLQPVSVHTTKSVRRSSNRGPPSDVQTDPQPLAEPSKGPLTDTLVVPESFFGTRTQFNQFGRPYCPGCDARLIKLPARFSIPWLRPYLYS